MAQNNVTTAGNGIATRTTVGQHFYSWSSLGSFAGSVSAVTIVGQVARSVGLGAADNNVFSLVVALVVVIGIAVATEPFVRGARRVDVFQKAVQTIFNALLVYSAATGLPTAVAVTS